MYFNSNLKYLLNKFNISIPELAFKLNLTRQCVSHYVHSDRVPHISILIKITNIFNVSLDDLITKDLKK